MKRVHQLMAVLLMALLIHPAPLVAAEVDGLEVACACCGDVPCEGCECVTESDRELPVPFAAEANAAFSVLLAPRVEESVISVPSWREEPRHVRARSQPALSSGRYCGRSCVLRR
jgi:hypothetical protein